MRAEGCRAQKCHFHSRQDETSVGGRKEEEALQGGEQKRPWNNCLNYDRKMTKDLSGLCVFVCMG